MNKRTRTFIFLLLLILAAFAIVGCGSSQESEGITEEITVIEEAPEPIVEPTKEPTAEPTIEPSPEPTAIPVPTDPNFPPAMIYHSAIFDSSDNQILIFGGNSKHGTNGDVKEVFSYDPVTGAWGESIPFDANPPWKNAFPPAYDIESDRAIILNMIGETWAFEFSSATWELMNPSPAPSGRCGHTMTYDIESDVVILYGGFACNSPMDPPSKEVWAYNYNTNTWEEMGTGPDERIYHTAAYDSESDRMLIWGGRPHTDNANTSIWAFDYNTNSWSEHPSDSAPSFRSSYHTMTYIPELDRTIIYGGVVLTGPFGGDFVLDVWEYDFNSNAWSLVVTSGDSPPALAKQVMVYDPGTGLAYMYGGSREVIYDDAFISYEFWSYDPINHIWDNLLID